ncbi:hypothetical protein K7432_014577, partial [Basidiobolus ranarum]
STAILQKDLAQSSFKGQLPNDQKLLYNTGLTVVSSYCNPSPTSTGPRSNQSGRTLTLFFSSPPDKLPA